MSLAERGAYIELLGVCWLEGSLPTDDDQLRRLAHAERDEWKKVRDAVLARFEEVGGRLEHAKLSKLRTEKDAYHATKAAAGRKGAAARWQGHPAANSKAVTGASAVPMANDGSASASAFASPFPPPPPIPTPVGGGGGDLESTLAAIGLRGISGELAAQIRDPAEALELAEEAKRQSNRDDWRGLFYAWVQRVQVREVLENRKPSEPVLPSQSFSVLPDVVGKLTPEEKEARDQALAKERSTHGSLTDEEIEHLDGGRG
jgi:uncharacterized protein YdaU (DUF1376 family)